MARAILLAAAAASVVPCGAFVPTSNVPSPPADVTVQRSASKGRQAATPQGASLATAAVLGLTIVGAALATAKARGLTRARGISAARPAERSPGFTARRATVYRDPVPKPAKFGTGKMSPSIPFLKYPEQLEGWVGGEKGFDPLGVTDALPVYLVREAELKHGRVCMLATVGWMATDSGIRFPAKVFQDVSTLQAHDKMVETGYMGIMLGLIAVLELYGGWLTLEGWAGNINREAGDFWVGMQVMPKKPENIFNIKLKELENGRLAMLAFAGIATQAAIFPEKTWPFLVSTTSATLAAGTELGEKTVTITTVLNFKTLPIP